MAVKRRAKKGRKQAFKNRPFEVEVLYGIEVKVNLKTSKFVLPPKEQPRGVPIMAGNIRL